jgi:hypothetical protein
MTDEHVSLSRNLKGFDRLGCQLSALGETEDSIDPRVKTTYGSCLDSCLKKSSLIIYQFNWLKNQYIW